jgi:hypothetical protein
MEHMPAARSRMTRRRLALTYIGGRCHVRWCRSILSIDATSSAADRTLLTTREMMRPAL